MTTRKKRSRRAKRDDDVLAKEAVALGISARPFELIPVDTPDRDAGKEANSLIRKLERQGQARHTHPMKMMRARTLYCRKLKSKRDTASDVGVPVSIVDRWVMVFGWEEERQKTEMRWYERVSNLRRRTMDCDEKHDRMYMDLETLVEDTIVRARNNTDPEQAIDAREIATLSQCVKMIQDGRRKIHKKDGAQVTNVMQIQGEAVFGEFAKMMAEITGAGREQIKRVNHTDSSDTLSYANEAGLIDHTVAEDCEHEELAED